MAHKFVKSEKHQYDVDLKEIFRLYVARINSENIISNHPKDYLIEQLRKKVNIPIYTQGENY